MFDVKNKVVQAEGRMINDGVIQSTLMYLPNLPAYEENGDYARSAMIRMKTDWGSTISRKIRSSSPTNWIFRRRLRVTT